MKEKKYYLSTNIDYQTLIWKLGRVNKVTLFSIYVFIATLSYKAMFCLYAL